MPRIRVQPRATAALLTLLGFAVLNPPPAQAATSPTAPQHDSFYRYAGNLTNARPGTVLKRRRVEVALGTNTTPLPAEQLLYRTTGQRGEPTVTVTTVLQPAAATASRIVEYLDAYDGLNPRCDPSFTLAGGDAGGAGEQDAEEEELLISWYLTNGFTVTVPDYEGTGLHWMAGRESGHGALDAIRATESYLHEPPTTKVGVSGYSGGAMAADWASELAPSYAPKLRIVGVAEGGIPVDYVHIFRYVNGTKEFSPAIPGMLLGLARAYGVKLRHYLSAYGARLAAQEAQGCMASQWGQDGEVTMKRVVKRRYGSVLRIRPLVRMLNQQTMGRVPGHPSAPLYMAVGNADGRGDGVMSAADVRTLAREYCAQGVHVRYDEYPGAQHVEAGAIFDPQTGPFLQAEFAGTPFPSNCASIKPGDSLAPWRLPARPTRGHRGHHAAAQSVTARPVADEARPGALAATGASDGVPLAGAALCLAACLAMCGRRKLVHRGRASTSHPRRRS